MVQCSWYLPPNIPWYTITSGEELQQTGLLFLRISLPDGKLLKLAYWYWCNKLAWCLVCQKWNVQKEHSLISECITDTSKLSQMVTYDYAIEE